MAYTVDDLILDPEDYLIFENDIIYVDGFGLLRCDSFRLPDLVMNFEKSPWYYLNGNQFDVRKCNLTKKHLIPTRLDNARQRPKRPYLAIHKKTYLIRVDGDVYDDFDGREVHTHTSGRLLDYTYRSLFARIMGTKGVQYRQIVKGTDYRRSNITTLHRD